MDMDLKLAGKVAIVTGGSKGIGYQTAKQFAAEGAQVVICARGEKQLQVAKDSIFVQTGKEILAVRADVSKEKDCQLLIQQAIEKFGRIDILVNNAGTAAANPFEQVTTEGWQHDLDLKLFGAIHCAKLAIPHMRAVGAGSIVNLTAIGGKNPGPSSMPTSVSRAAGLALMKAMSKDIGKDNIRVNAVCIGLIRSDQIEKRWQSVAPELTWEEFSKQEGASIPLGRVGEAEEAANMIVFLSSPAASYITGTAVNIDGGTANSY